MTRHQISVDDPVTEWEIRGCVECDIEPHIRKYGTVDGLLAPHSILHDRQAAVDRCNRLATEGRRDGTYMCGAGDQ